MKEGSKKRFDVSKKKTLDQVVFRFKEKARDISTELLDILREIEAVKKKDVVEEDELEEDDLEEIDLEEEVEIEGDEEDEEDTKGEYKHPDYFEIAFVNEFYNQQYVDYNEIFSYLGAHRKEELAEEFYEKSIEGEERKGEMRGEEAEKFVRKVQYHMVVKSHETLDVEDRERFSYWQEFNKSMLRLFYHQTGSLRSDDVDYGRINSFVYV